MTARRYAFIRGRLLDDPDYGLSGTGTETVTLRIGVRMPTGYAEPVSIEAGDAMPSYCRRSRLRQGDMVVASGWMTPEGEQLWPSVMAETATLSADMLAAGTSLDFREEG